MISNDEAMSGLRIIGLITGVGGLLLTFFFYRGSKWKKKNFVFLSAVNLFLILVSIYPDSVNVLRDLLSLQEAQYGRLLALLVSTNVFLLFFTFYTSAKLENMHIQFDKLVRRLGIQEANNAAEHEDKIIPIIILIPAYNEAENLRELLPRIPSKVGNQDVGVLVVDDGSDDDTFFLAKMPRVRVIRCPINRGGGAALRLGYDFLKTHFADICVTMDADCQHQPEEVERLVTPILEGRYDIVIGSRIKGGWEKDSAIRHAGIHVFSFLINGLLGVRITDPSNGFRAFRLDILKNIELKEDQYHTSELLIEGAKKGLRIGEVPITITKRRYGKSKKGKNFIYGFYFAKTIIKTWWR